MNFNFLYLEICNCSDYETYKCNAESFEKTTTTIKRTWSDETGCSETSSQNNVKSDCDISEKFEETPCLNKKMNTTKKWNTKNIQTCVCEPNSFTFEEGCQSPAGS